MVDLCNFFVYTVNFTENSLSIIHLCWFFFVIGVGKLLMLLPNHVVIDRLGTQILNEIRKMIDKNGKSKKKNFGLT